MTHITAERLANRSRWISALDAPQGDAKPPVRRGPPDHPRAERVVWKSRDFQ